MCILRLRLLNHRSPHSFIKIDRWEDPVKESCVLRKKNCVKTVFCASFHLGASYKWALPVVARLRDQQNLL